MKLVKFKIVSVKENRTDEEYSKGFDFKTKYHRFVWDYEIIGDDGNIYFIPWRSTSILGLVKGKNICANVLQSLKQNTGFSIELEPNRFEIKWNSVNRPGIMTLQKFAIEVKKQILREKETLEWTEKEIKRLQELVK